MFVCNVWYDRWRSCWLGWRNRTTTFPTRQPPPTSSTNSAKSKSRWAQSDFFFSIYLFFLPPHPLSFSFIPFFLFITLPSFHHYSSYSHLSLSSHLILSLSVFFSPLLSLSRYSSSLYTHTNILPHYQFSSQLVQGRERHRS